MTRFSDFCRKLRSVFQQIQWIYMFIERSLSNHITSIYESFLRRSLAGGKLTVLEDLSVDVTSGYGDRTYTGFFLKGSMTFTAFPLKLVSICFFFYWWILSFDNPTKILLLWSLSWIRPFVFINILIKRYPTDDPFVDLASLAFFYSPLWAKNSSQRLLIASAPDGCLRPYKFILTYITWKDFSILSISSMSHRNSWCYKAYTLYLLLFADRTIFPPDFNEYETINSFWLLTFLLGWQNKRGPTSLTWDLQKTSRLLWLEQ